MESKTLKGNLIYTEINIADSRMPYREGSRLAGQFYYVGRWGARGFTCSEAIKKLWDKGQIRELTISETSYKRVNPSTGVEETVESAVINGYMDREKAKTLLLADAEYEVASVKAEVMIKNARLVALNDLGLNEADMKLLKEAL